MNEHDKAIATIIPEPTNPVEFFLQTISKEVAKDLRADNESYVEFGHESGLCYNDAILCASRLKDICESRGWSVDLDINSINNRNRWVKMWIEV